MMELNSYRKNKVNLDDYDYQKDIKNRLLMASFSPKDLEVLEEILFSSLKFPISQLAETTELSEEELEPILLKVAETGLIEIKDKQIFVDKELRKYFEAQMIKFEEDFTPGMEFLQTLLKKVPIQVLPNWYPIPRTSNNIFDSLIERYLITPQTFQRYLSELNFPEPALREIVEDVFASPDYEVPSSLIRKKYHLSQEKFEEYMLLLEFNFVCCLVYTKKDDEYEEFVTLFQEWKDYLRFINKTHPAPIEDQSAVIPFFEENFAFANAVAKTLSLAQKTSLVVKINQKEEWTLDKKSASEMEHIGPREERAAYLTRLIQKIVLLKLAKIEKSRLVLEPLAEEWLGMPNDKRALFIYKQTLYRVSFDDFSDEASTERNIREIEKSLSRIEHDKWVLYDEYLAGMTAPLSEKSKMTLQKKGKYWEYALPDYTEEEKRLIHLITYEWLFEGGMIQRGMLGDQPCIRVTPLGKSLFG